MNWLAHILLSKPDTHFQLGNLLADTLKGKAWQGAHPHFAEGLAAHKAIDRFTDCHPIVIQSKNRLAPNGLLRGVVIDILYDHFLAKHWNDYVDISLETYLHEFRTAALPVAAHFPDQPRRFVERLIGSDTLLYYREFDGFAEALARTDRRLSPRLKARETATQHLHAVRREYQLLGDDFQAFFADLLANKKPLLL